MIGMLIQRIAQSVGHSSRHTQTPAEFLRSIDEWCPTHVAVDLNMPEMSGVEVMGALAARGCQARIIITSGADPATLANAGREAATLGLSVAGVLPKPFHPEALRSLL